MSHEAEGQITTNQTKEIQTLTAYELFENSGYRIIPAPIERQWMSDSAQRFAYRCLPLNIANQNGWQILCPFDFSAYWYGGLKREDIEIRFPNGTENRVTSHFGEGVITFSMPFLFRTSPGINIWAKGPSNLVKDGIQALEGIIEADWAVSTFTMNWKFTRANHWIEFKKDEPFCMLVPIPRGFTEEVKPIRRQMSTNPELQQEFKNWELSRSQFLADLMMRNEAATARGWQKDYFQGKTKDGVYKQHQTRLQIDEFEQQ